MEVSAYPRGRGRSGEKARKKKSGTFLDSAAAGGHRTLCAGRPEPKRTVNMKHCYDNRETGHFKTLRILGVLR